MIVEGCDILLDVNQMFVRQGTLVQIIHRGDSHGLGGAHNVNILHNMVLPVCGYLIIILLIIMTSLTVQIGLTSKHSHNFVVRSRSGHEPKPFDVR